MKKIIINRCARLCACLILFAACIYFFSLGLSPGTDYTKEYHMYQDISNISELSELENYLNDNDIAYTISGNTLTLEDYKNIEYVIYNDNTSGKLIHSNLMYRLSKLDENDYDVVSIDSITIDDKTTERVYFEKGVLTYSKINSNYYINACIIYKWTALIALIAAILNTMNLTFDITDDICKYLKKKQEIKKSNNASAEPVTEK